MLIMSIVVMRDPMVHFGPSIHVRFAALQMIDLFRGLELNMWSVELITLGGSACENFMHPYLSNSQNGNTSTFALTTTQRV